MMAPIQRIHAGPRMSQAVIHSRTVYLAGQVALGCPGASVRHQTQNILKRVDELLAEVGSSKLNLLAVTIWLSEMESLDEMNAVWDEWIVNGQAPARATVESARLASPGYAVEIAVIAAVL